MKINKYLYFLSYDNHERELCKLELRSVFNEEDNEKLLFSDIKTEPSSSAFIKRRLEIISYSEDYLKLINNINQKKICSEGFKVEYIVMNGDTTNYAKRLEKLKDIGYCIEGEPDYHKPTQTYALIYFNNVWYFGFLVKNKYMWLKHKKKPYSFSNSIHINIAKALINIAVKTNYETKLLDACCGVGTIMLEACFAGYKIDGCDINWKVCRQARQNLAHFNYNADVYRSDIKDINQKYDAAIIDLPYNLFSCADEATLSHIIISAKNIVECLIIVSISDISELIRDAGLKISDSCRVGKSGKGDFIRKIWVCEKLL